jgi:hypothetical protein
MADKKNHDDRLESLMNQLAESVLGLSDEAILVETSEAGADPQREAERTRSVLRQASKALDNVNNRLSDLGHTINSKDWWGGQWGYHNTCQTCGAFVSFKTATGEMRGNALDEQCPESDKCTIHRREASGK